MNTPDSQPENPSIELLQSTYSTLRNTGENIDDVLNLISAIHSHHGHALSQNDHEYLESLESKLPQIQEKYKTLQQACERLPELRDLHTIPELTFQKSLLNIRDEIGKTIPMLLELRENTDESTTRITKVIQHLEDIPMSTEAFEELQKLYVLIQHSLEESETYINQSYRALSELDA